MVNVFSEMTVSEASAEDQLFHWKHDTKGIFNCFKNVKAIFYSLEQL